MINYSGYESYQTLKAFGIDAKVMTLLPEEPHKISALPPDCLILENIESRYALWIHHGQEASLANQNQLLRFFELSGFEGFLYPIPLNDHRTYAPLDGRRWFYITRWPESRRILFSSDNDLMALVNLLIDFRKVLHDTGGGYFLPERKRNVDLQVKIPAMIQSLHSFALLAKYRLKPTNFDRLFVRYCPEAIVQAEQSLNLLKTSGYRELIAQITIKDMTMNRLIRSNLRITSQNRGICLRSSDLRQDLPIIDLGTLLVKTGRSAQWNFQWFDRLVAQYKRYFSISMNEQKVLLAFLTFPWSFYRLAARYYYNRTEWPLVTYVDRLERILRSESDRVKLVTLLAQ